MSNGSGIRGLAGRTVGVGDLNDEPIGTNLGISQRGDQQRINWKDICSCHSLSADLQRKLAHDNNREFKEISLGDLAVHSTLIKTEMLQLAIQFGEQAKAQTGVEEVEAEVIDEAVQILKNAKLVELDFITSSGDINVNDRITLFLTKAANKLVCDIDKGADDLKKTSRVQDQGKTAALQLAAKVLDGIGKVQKNTSSQHVNADDNDRLEQLSPRLREQNGSSRIPTVQVELNKLFAQPLCFDGLHQDNLGGLPEEDFRQYPQISLLDVLQGSASASACFVAFAKKYIEESGELTHPMGKTEIQLGSMRFEVERQLANAQEDLTLAAQKAFALIGNPGLLKYEPAPIKEAIQALKKAVFDHILGSALRHKIDELNDYGARRVLHKLLKQGEFEEVHKCLNDKDVLANKVKEKTSAAERVWYGLINAWLALFRGIKGFGKNIFAMAAVAYRFIANIFTEMWVGVRDAVKASFGFAIKKVGPLMDSLATAGLKNAFAMANRLEAGNLIKCLFKGAAYLFSSLVWLASLTLKMLTVSYLLQGVIGLAGTVLICVAKIVTKIIVITLRAVRDIIKQLFTMFGAEKVYQFLAKVMSKIMQVLAWLSSLVLRVFGIESKPDEEQQPLNPAAGRT